MSQEKDILRIIIQFNNRPENRTLPLLNNLVLVQYTPTVMYTLDKDSTAVQQYSTRQLRYGAM